MNEVITIDSAALQELIIRMAEHLQSQKEEYEWVDTATCMKMLGISSRTTLQKHRDCGHITFSITTTRKNILYSRSSIIRFIEANKREAFNEK